MTEVTAEAVAGVLAFTVRAQGLGLTGDEYGVVVQAQNAVRAACETAARRALSERRPDIVQRLEAAEAESERCLDKLVPGDMILAAKRAELEEVNRRIGRCARVDEDTDLDEWVTAEATRGALERRQIELQARIGLVADNQSPALAEAAAWRGRAETARTELAELDRCIAAPLGTLTGLTTAPGQYWLCSGAWLEHLADPGTVEGNATRGMLTEVLRATGIGAQVQTAALDAARRQQQRAAGLEVRDGMGIATAPLVTDPSRLPPVQQQVGAVNADIEMSQLRQRAGVNMDGSQAAARPRPGGYIAVDDMSMTPGNLLDTAQQLPGTDRLAG